MLMVPLTFLERRKTKGGSSFLPLYLFATLLFDFQRSRTFSSIPVLRTSSLFPLFVTSIIVKGIFFILENSKGSDLNNSTRENRASFASRMFFLWLFSVIWLGYRKSIEVEDLDVMKGEFKVDRLYSELSRTLFNHKSGGGDQRINETSDQDSQFQGSSKPASRSSHFHEESEGVEMEDLSKGTERSQPDYLLNLKMKRSLLSACLHAFPTSILILPVFWRLVLTAANLALPFLVSHTLDFANSYSKSDDPPSEPPATGYALVGATFLVYLVISISTGQFFWAVNKAEVKVRGSLVALVFQKALKLDLATRSISGGGSAPSNLMSVDVERITTVFEAFHTLWSGILTIGVATYLLYLQVGLVFLAPLIAIFIILALTPLLGKGIGKAQADWSR